MDLIKKYTPLWGKWIPTECIGEGKFGSVYRVKDKNNIQKDCAVKRITLRKRQLNLPSAENFSADDFLKLQIQTAGKCIREIELIDVFGTVTNIVTIHNYDIFPSTDTIDILLHMELLTSLSSLMKTEALDRSEIIRIGIDLCDALISCEKHQIIHSDIKPNNIFRDSEGHYKLGDFGLSRQITASALTSLCGFGGTPLYKAPEALMWGQKVDYKTDQYALGIILYQLLNDGKTPFCEDMNDPFELEESIRRKLEGEELLPPVNENGELWKIVKKACELEKINRYPSAVEMKQDLQKLLGISKTNVKFEHKEKLYKNAFSTFQTAADREQKKIKTVLKSRPILMVQESQKSSDTMLFRKFPRNDIKEVVFLDTLSDAPNNAKDLSAKQDLSVLGWLKNGMLYIAGENGVMANTDSSNLFCWCSNIKKIDFNYCFDTSNVTDMHRMFFGCKSLTTLDLTDFDTSNVTNMSEMFYDCHCNLTTIDFTGFDTSNVTDMHRMFYGCESLTTLDFTDFDTSNVTNMSEMFFECYELTTLDLSGFDTSNVTDMHRMFYGCESLTIIDFTGFNTSNVTDMHRMFYGCDSLTTLDLSGFDTSSVISMKEMFACCNSLTFLNLSGFDTSNVTNMGEMFFSCESLTTLDLSGFDTSNVTNMGKMFCECYELTTLNLSGFDNSNVIDMHGMFYDCESLTIIDFTGFDTSNVTDMHRMFYGCKSLTTLDFTGFDTGNVTNMHGMFNDCESLTALDLSSFDTSNVTDMHVMFHGCESLITLDLTDFDTSNVTDMHGMFNGCESLTALDLSSFDTSNVTDMRRMFTRCESLTFLNLSGFDISNVSDMSEMFDGCSASLKEKCKLQLKR